MNELDTGLEDGDITDEELAAVAAEVQYEYLAFVLLDEHYALPLAGVQEILKPPPITEVPRAARDVLGIVSVRGRVTTVLDLRDRMNMEPAKITKNSRILLIDSEVETIGLLVDAVLQVYRLKDEEIELASSVGGDMNEHVMGIGRPRAIRTLGRSSTYGREDLNDILILLDAEALLRS